MVKNVEHEQTHEILMEFTKEVKNILGESLKKVILYGSYARGDYHKNSDMDIMILVSLDDAEISQVENQIYNLSFDFQMEYFVDISVIIKNETHFNFWLGAVPFYDNVKREGVILLG